MGLIFDILDCRQRTNLLITIIARLEHLSRLFRLVLYHIEVRGLSTQFLLVRTFISFFLFSMLYYLHRGLYFCWFYEFGGSLIRNK